MTYEVKFDDGQRLVVEARDRDDAQEKAIDLCEQLDFQHGNIVAIEALDCE